MTKLCINNILIGADPEVFLQERRNQEFMSAIGLIGGTKRSPRPISDVGHYVQEDNVAVEFNIPPSKNAESMTAHINRCLNWVTKNIHDNLEISHKCSARFRPDLLNNEKAQHFGCDPDLNAWTKQVNNKPEESGNLRTCGGHIHVGYQKVSQPVSLRLVKAMDLFLGTPSIILDKDTERRMMYGKAGACRLKSYGVEYRVLSNFWVFSAELIQWAFTNTLKAVEFVNTAQELSEDDEQAVQQAINYSDSGAAMYLIDRHNISVPAVAVTV